MLKNLITLIKNLFENGEIKEAGSKAQKLFTEHPGETGETYFQHFVFTGLTSLRIIFCGIIIFIHGLFPFLFTRTASRHVERIYLILKKRIPKSRRYDSDGELPCSPGGPAASGRRTPRPVEKPPT